MPAASSSASALPPPPSEHLRNGRPAGPPVFLLALLFGVIVHLGVLLLFHFTVLPARTAGVLPPAPYIHYNDIANSTALQTLVAEAQFSPEQTYLSTEKSFSSQALPPTAAPLHPVFAPFTVQPASSEVDFRQPIPAAQVATGPDDALKPTQWDLLSSFGQAHPPGNKLAARGAFVRITRLETLGSPNIPAIELVWPPNLAPPIGNTAWQPVSFILQFNAAGLASEPVIEPGFDAMAQGNSPNDPRVNDFLRDTLREWFTQNPPLPPGQYEAVVGP